MPSVTIWRQNEKHSLETADIGVFVGVNRRQALEHDFFDMTSCRLCPRECGADRSKGTGYCGVGAQIRVAKAMKHFGEEPPISGTKGSGAVFFSGCSMKCRFCQNYQISDENYGREITVSRLADIFLELQEQGAHNINLVTASHFIPRVISALDIAKPRLQIPVVFNCGGYERAEAIRLLKGYVDIYLPDVKYFSDELAVRYSSAPHYFSHAYEALKEMLSQTGSPVFDGDNIMQKGVIVRHLILPGCYKDSIKIMEQLAALPERFLVSLMRQYTPCHKAADYPEINRRLTTFEYRKVVDKCCDLGLDGFTQEKESATLEMTPSFDLSGV